MGNSIMDCLRGGRRPSSMQPPPPALPSSPAQSVHDALVAQRQQQRPPASTHATDTTDAAQTLRMVAQAMEWRSRQSRQGVHPLFFNAVLNSALDRALVDVEDESSTLTSTSSSAHKSGRRSSLSTANKLLEQHVSTLEKFDTCCICVDKLINLDELILVLPCNHPFHTSCLYKWVIIDNSCPTCRRPAIPIVTTSNRYHRYQLLEEEDEAHEAHETHETDEEVGEVVNARAGQPQQYSYNSFTW